MRAINSSILGGEEMQKDDETLVRLRTAIDPIVTEIENDVEGDKAVMMIAAREVETPSGDTNIQTYIDIVGELSLMQEALYGELEEQIRQGRLDLFQALREVIHTLEQEQGIEPDDDIEGPRVLH